MTTACSQGGLGTAPSDDEAVPMRKKTVIDKGRLALFLYNTYAANKDKTALNGERHARRV